MHIGNSLVPLLLEPRCQTFTAAPQPFVTQGLAYQIDTAFNHREDGMIVVVTSMQCDQGILDATPYPHVTFIRFDQRLV